MKLNLLKNVKNIIGAVAPTIGTALGGPMGSMAANMVAEALGCEPEQKKIEAAVQAATPEQLAELKSLYDDELISEDDYNAKKQEILDNL